MLRIFHLYPVRRSAGAIGAIAMLRYQTLESELSSLAEQVRSDLALFKRRDEDTVGPARRGWLSDP
jgi:hypothetical protein